MEKRVQPPKGPPLGTRARRSDGLFRFKGGRARRNGGQNTCQASPAPGIENGGQQHHNGRGR